MMPMMQQQNVQFEMRRRNINANLQSRPYVHVQQPNIVNRYQQNTPIIQDIENENENENENDNIPANINMENILNENIPENIPENIQSKQHMNRNKRDNDHEDNGADNGVDNDVVVIKPQKDKIITNSFINSFGNLLDPNNLQDKDDDYYFKPCKNNDNVVKSIRPELDNAAHFDRLNYPDESYLAKMFNGNIQRYSAKDLSNYTLETQKNINNHTNNINNLDKIIPLSGFVYARTSNKNDISIDTQRNACFNYCTNNSIKLLEFGFQYDMVSARNMNNLNHELGFWLDYIDDNSNIVIYSIDRLSRNLEKGIQFLKNMAKRNISIHFVMENIIYKKGINAAQLDLVYNALKNAENVSNMTSEKVKNSIKKRKDEGHYFGRPSYGYKVVKINGIRQKVMDNDQQDIIKKIYAKFHEIASNIDALRRNNNNIQNNRTSIYKFLIKWLISKNIKQEDGKPFTVKQINRIIVTETINVSIKQNAKEIKKTAVAIKNANNNTTM